MKTIATHRARTKISRLRLVFSDRVVTRELLANATFEDVARTLGRISKRRYGSPLAIHVIVDSATPAGPLH